MSTLSVMRPTFRADPAKIHLTRVDISPLATRSRRGAELHGVYIISYLHSNALLIHHVLTIAPFSIGHTTQPFKMLAPRFLRPAFGAARPSAQSAPRQLQNSLHQAQQRSFGSNPTSSRPKWNKIWQRGQHHHQHRPYRRQAFNYQRFQSTSNLFRRWRARPTFYYEIAGIGGTATGIYIYNLEEVPVSRRRRFNVVGAETETNAGKQMYQQTMQEYGRQILPDSHPKAKMVRRVLDRLIPHSGLEGEEWEVHVIEDPMKNAFVIPGGKVFVFSGILDVCKGDDGLAAVLGHEIAHNVAHHAAERMSSSYLLLAIGALASFAVGVDIGIGNFLVDLAFLRPGSRAQEAEADYIGLLMMSESCYDPSAAMGLWARMEEEEKNAPPQFLSTHPSNHNRLEKIRGWLPEAEARRENSECGITAGFGMCEVLYGLWRLNVLTSLQLMILNKLSNAGRQSW